jgi:hypothetical protein
MNTLTELAYNAAAGDLVVVETPLGSGVFDLSVVGDSEAVNQDAALNLNLQSGFNQYTPDAGWDIFRYLNANLTQTDIEDICKQIKRLMERIDFVTGATCTYLGSQQVGSQYIQIFDVRAMTTFGTIKVPYALGGF